MKRKFSMTIRRGAEGETVSMSGSKRAIPLDYDTRQLLVKTFATATRQPISRGKKAKRFDGASA
jgi:hypothetical protein